MEGLEEIETSTITEVLIEKFIDLLHEAGLSPATVGSVAGLPGGVTINRMWG
jgi:hypothetical protein